MSKKKQEKERKKQKKDRKERSKLGKLLRRLLLLALIGVLLCGAAHMFVVFRGQSLILELDFTDGEISAGLPAKKADCILILGAGVSGGEPSPILRERLDLGAALYRAGASDRILVSGDNGRNEYNEVQTMEDYLVDKQGIPREHIVRDHAGFCTYDSLVRAKEIFCVNSLIIVTQKYHLFRAAYIADAIGLETYGADAHRTDYAGRSARECLARVKDFFLCILRPDPCFLGEQLPIT